MKVLLWHLDGKLPNLALMRLAAHHRALGDQVELRQAETASDLQPRLGDPAWGRVYGSLIFEWTRPLAREAERLYPSIQLGGTGWDFEGGDEYVPWEEWWGRARGNVRRLGDRVTLPLFPSEVG
jgi:hypothetical protein